nr:chromosome transmission fidelity protein 8 homolog [Tanacetum cinerariifolium]
MEIKLKCGCGESNCPEWAMIEVQGVVEVQPAFQHSLSNLQIGILCRPSSQENYTFTVGYHELTGSKIPLKKPLLVLKKKAIESDMEIDQNEDDAVNSSRVELEVIGIIRQRILFKTRPKALISKPHLAVKDKISAPHAVVEKQT